MINLVKTDKNDFCSLIKSINNQRKEQERIKQEKLKQQQELYNDIFNVNLSTIKEFMCFFETHIDKKFITVKYNNNQGDAQIRINIDEEGWDNTYTTKGNVNVGCILIDIVNSKISIKYKYKHNTEYKDIQADITDVNIFIERLMFCISIYFLPHFKILLNF